jgi:predicted ATP-dependent serine protease
MTSILDFSPAHTLFPDSFCGQKGELGLVVSDVGVGKSTLITHLGLHTLILEGTVLHVSLNTPQAQVRARYEEVIRSLEQSSGLSISGWIDTIGKASTHSSST